MGVYPVTQSQWRALMGANPSSFKTASRPVESVSWEECQQFCQRLSEILERLVRLPREAEWEYACRGGTTTMFYTGEGEEAMRKAGWCSSDSEIGNAGNSQPVGQYLPNPWGLYDMHGNVREWCDDGMRDYTPEPVTDPIGAGPTDHRVVRGGSWNYSSEDSRSASRYLRPASYHLPYYGFRVLMPWVKPTGAKRRRRRPG
jgi:formylglycine-generating enzyme required for sulfatase activity